MPSANPHLMTSGISTFQRAIWLALIATVPVSAQTDVPVNNTRDALLLARKHCVSVQAGGATGSAVFLDFHKQEGDKGVFTFVTAFHVVAGSNLITLGVEGSPDVPFRTILSSDFAGQQCEVAVDPLRDLAFIRFSTDLTKLKSLKAVDNAEAKQGHYVEVRVPNKERLDLFPVLARLPFRPKPKAIGLEDFTLGFAFGFPQYDRKSLTPIPIQLGRCQTAREIYRLYATVPDTIPADFDFRLSSWGSTAPGMSGGLVLDNGGGFVGLVHGRVLDTINLIIPAEDLKTRYSTLKGSQWKALKDAAALLKGDTSPYIGARSSARFLARFGGTETNYFSHLRWTDLTHFAHYFNDPARLRVAFQEVMFSDAHFPKVDSKRPPTFELVINKESFPGPGADRKESVDVWLNALPGEGAKPRSFNEGGRLLLKDLVPGENLLIIRKQQIRKPDGPPDLNLTTFLNDSVLDFSIKHMPSEETYRVLRALPGIVSSYDVYVTITLPPAVEPFDGYMAARVPWLERTLRGVALDLDVSARYEQSGIAAFQGTILLGQKLEVGKLAKEVTPAPLSIEAPAASRAQHFDLRIPAVINAKDVFVDFYGVRIHQRELPLLPIEGRLRVQWIHRGGGKSMLVVARLLTAAPSRPVPVPLKLGDLTLNVDVAPAVQEVVINYLNNAYLHPHDPVFAVDIPIENMMKTLNEVSVTPLAGLTLKQLFVHEGWLVGTFRSKVPLKDNPETRFPKLPSAESAVVVDILGNIPTMSREQFRVLFRDETAHPTFKRLVPDCLPPMRLAFRLLEGKNSSRVRGEQSKKPSKFLLKLGERWRAEVEAGEPRGAVKVPASVFTKLVAGVVEVKDEVETTGFIAIGHKAEIGRVGDCTATISTKSLHLGKIAIEAPKLSLEPIVLDEATSKHVEFALRVQSKKISSATTTMFVKDADVYGTLRMPLPGIPGDTKIIEISFPDRDRVKASVVAGGTSENIGPKLAKMKLEIRDGDVWQKSGEHK